MCRHGWFVALSAIFFASFVLASEVKMSPEGWEIDSGELGKLTIAYPQIGMSGKMLPARDVTFRGKTTLMSYDNGATLRIVDEGDGVYLCHFQNVPESARSFRMELRLPMSLASNAKWKIDDHERSFPAEYGGSPALHQQDAKRFSVTGRGGDGFSVAIEYGFMRMQDNREWKNNSFLWYTTSGIPAGESYRRVRIVGSPDGAAAVHPPQAAQAAPAPPQPQQKASADAPAFAISGATPPVQ